MTIATVDDSRFLPYQKWNKIASTRENDMIIIFLIIQVGVILLLKKKTNIIIII